MTPKQKEKFLRNILQHTAPILTIFFAQMATGVDIKAALLVAVYAGYALASDYFSKLK